MGNFVELFYRAYADDLVFILKHTQLKRLIKIISKLCPIYNLKLNPKKSNWMRLKNLTKANTVYSTTDTQ